MDCGDSALTQPPLPIVVLRARLGAALAGAQRPLGGALEPRNKGPVARRTPDALSRVAMGSTRDVDPSTPAEVMMRMVRQVAMGAPGGSCTT